MKKEIIEKHKNIILRVSGGIGKNIMATAVIKNLKLAYPEKTITVVAGFPDIFMYNPNVKKVFGFDKTQNLYEDYIDKYSAISPGQTILIDIEPYLHPEYLSGNKHLIDAWCEMIDIPCVTRKPELYFTDSENAFTESIFAKFTDPMIIFQHQGGKIPQNETKQARIEAEAGMYRRSLREKTVQQISDALIEDGYMIGSVNAPTQFQPVGSERIYYNIRITLALLKQAVGVICIDSFILHACAALDIPALVLWMGTSPEKLGYDIHTNLRRNVCATPECHRPNSFAHDISTNGMMWDCPFNDICRDYDAKMVVEAYKKMKGEEYKTIVQKFKKDKKSVLNNAPRPTMGLADKAHCPKC